MPSVSNGMQFFFGYAKKFCGGFAFVIDFPLHEVPGKGFGLFLTGNYKFKKIHFSVSNAPVQPHASQVH